MTALPTLAEELGVVIPISIFERTGRTTYNSLVMVDADGAMLGVYRKSHIPDGPGYQEKYYFRPGDTGFKVWDTRFGRIGVGICWDQWFPEAARAMALLGAEVLFYPTAIGSSRTTPTLDTAAPWRRAMQGHAVSNVDPGGGGQPHRAPRTTTAGQRFYGPPSSPTIAATWSRARARRRGRAGAHVRPRFLTETHRAAWGFFRDRRTDLYAKGAP